MRAEATGAKLRWLRRIVALAWDSPCRGLSNHRMAAKELGLRPHVTVVGFYVVMAQMVVAYIVMAYI